MNYEEIIENEILPFLTKETCKLLRNRCSDLTLVEWSRNESNIDEGFSLIAKECCKNVFSNSDYSSIFGLAIEPPDLILTFSSNNFSIGKKIELKSTKADSLPGSMTMSLDPNIWTIICKRDKDNKNFKFRYGRYHLGIDIKPHEKFQDRSPRPVLYFKNFQTPDDIPNTKKVTKDSQWWKLYAEAAITRILEPKNHSWQDDLVKEIVKIVISDPEKFDHFKNS